VTLEHYRFSNSRSRQPRFPSSTFAQCNYSALFIITNTPLKEKCLKFDRL